MSVTKDRQENRQRVRWGLTGLAFVFLFVLIGAAVSRLGEASSSEQARRGAATQVTGAPDEPLAELGVAPSQAPSTNATVDRPSGKTSRP